MFYESMSRENCFRLMFFLRAASFSLGLFLDLDRSWEYLRVGEPLSAIEHLDRRTMMSMFFKLYFFKESDFCCR